MPLFFLLLLAPISLPIEYSSALSLVRQAPAGVFHCARQMSTRIGDGGAGWIAAATCNPS